MDMDNEILRQLRARRSVRAFLDRPVPPEVKRAVLEAACAAPTAGNQQLYTILDITDQAIKDALAETCDHQPFIAQAPVVLIFCADCLRWWDAYRAAGCAPRRPGPGDLMLAVTDAAISAQNLVVAAESLGLGSCYIGDIMERYEDHRRLLRLPPWVFPACMLVLGWPTRQQRERKKPERFDLSYVVHENGYRRLDEAALRSMFRGRCGGQTFEGFLSAFCARKYESDFSREMSRSVGEYLLDLERAGAPEGEK